MTDRDDVVRLPAVLMRFWYWILALTGASVVFTLVMTRLLKTRTPYGLYVLWNGGQWWDFRVFADRFHSFRQPDFWELHHYPFTYPAPLGVAFGLAYKLEHPLRWYLSGLCLAIAVGAWLLCKALIVRGVAPLPAVLFVATVVLTSWPLAILLGTANSEGLVVLFCSAGAAAVLWNRGWLGAGLIGIAAGMKFFPILLLGLLLSQRRYREFAFGLAVAGGVTVVSLAVLGPSVAAANAHIVSGLHFVPEFFLFTVAPEPFLVEHSLFTAVKVTLVIVDRALFGASDVVARAAREYLLLKAAFSIYLVVVAVLGVALYFARIRKLPMLNQLMALTVCAVLLPPLSVDYTLVHLLFPFALLCLYAVDRRRESDAIPGLNAAFACFAILFTTATYWTVRYRFGSAPRTLALAALLWISVAYPFHWREWKRAGRWEVEP